MADYGVLPTGFVKKRLDVIRAEIVASLLTSVGRPVVTTPNSITGQLIDTFAEREAALWEQAEAVYHAMYPSSAFGTSLDNAVSFTGVRRLGDLPTQVFAVLYGTDTLVIPAGSLASMTNSQAYFELQADTTISSATAVDVSFVITAVLNLTDYAVTIDGTTYSYTSLASAVLSDIIAGLSAALLPSTLNISSDGASIRIVSDGRATFSIAVSSHLAIVTLGSISSWAAVDAGPTVVDANMLNTIITRLAGWDSINNIQPGLTGRFAESDSDLRSRYDSGVFQTGAATQDAIKAGIQDNVAGVTTAIVLANKTDDVDADGRPPHSVELVVDGGDDLAIGAELLLLVAAGIDTTGSVSVNATDVNGDVQVMKFSRPTKVYVWAKCIITLLTEETLPDNALTLIAQSVVATGNALAIGGDVVTQRFYGPIYAAVTGIGSINLTFASSTDPAFSPASGDYSAANITIAATARAKFDITRVNVT